MRETTTSSQIFVLCLASDRSSKNLKGCELGLAHGVKERWKVTPSTRLKVAIQFGTLQKISPLSVWRLERVISACAIQRYDGMQWPVAFFKSPEYLATPVGAAPTARTTEDAGEKTSHY